MLSCWQAILVLYLHNTNQPVLLFATTSSQTVSTNKLLPSQQVQPYFSAQSIINKHRILIYP
jgi:hypothetical protein